MQGKNVWSMRGTYLSAIVLCLCFLACGLGLLFHMAAQGEQENAQYLDTIAVQNQVTIEKQVTGDLQTLEGIAVCFGELSAGSSENRNLVLQKINDQNTFIRMGLSDLEGNLTLVSIGGKQDSFQLRGRPFFTQALAGESALSPTLEDSLVPGTYINYYAVPVRNAAGEIVSVLCAVNSSTTFSQIISATVFGGQGFSCIVDSTGKIIIRSTNRNCPASASRLQDFGTYSEETWSALSKSLLAGNHQLFQFSMDGKKQIAVTQPLGINDWSVVSIIPEGALRERYRQTIVILTVLIAAACAVFLILLIHQKRITNKGQQYLMRVAFCDPLTGSRNLNRFLLDAQDVLQKHPGQSFCIWYCDLKRFKYFNDMFGYQKGDRMLYWLSDLLRKYESETSIYCRSSADNFVGLRPFQEQEELSAWFEELLKTLQQEHKDTSRQLKIELSMGFYCLVPTDRDTDINDMINWANMAQKEVKAIPGSHCAFFDKAIRRRFQYEAELEAQGSLALSNGEFAVYFQPKVNIQEGNRIAGAEALSRWIHPKKGLIPPDSFIPLFEKTGLIVRFDRSVFAQVCKWARDYLDEGLPPINLAINVSRLGLMQEDFIPFYASVKEQYGIPDGMLELEFTESVFLNDTEMFLNTVRELHERGFICSLDDFGSGYSSLNLLKVLPIDVLKLDILFFRKGADIQRERTILSNIINMTKELKIESIAEGVEYAEQVDYLRGAGCDLVQGYVFSQPLPLEAFDRLLRESGGGVLRPKDFA